MNRAIFIKDNFSFAGSWQIFQAPRHRNQSGVALRSGRSQTPLIIWRTGFELFCKTFFNALDIYENPDVESLRLLNGIPSLEPFLVRELLGLNGLRPVGLHLKITPVDIRQMLGFANEEVERLMRVAFDRTIRGADIKLASEILSNEMDRKRLPLKTNLRQSKSEFSDDIFSCRSFLDFKGRHLEP